MSITAIGAAKAAAVFDEGHYMQVEVAGKLAATDQPEGQADARRASPDHADVGLDLFRLSDGRRLNAGPPWER